MKADNQEKTKGGDAPKKKERKGRELRRRKREARTREKVSPIGSRTGHAMSPACPPKIDGSSASSSDTGLTDGLVPSVRPVRLTCLVPRALGSVSTLTARKKAW